MPTKINVQKGAMLNNHHEIQSYGPMMQHFNRSKIKEFYNNNEIRINTIIEERNKLLLEYYQVDENKNILLDENKKRVLQEGKTEEEYEAAFKKLMAEETVLTL